MIAAGSVWVTGTSSVPPPGRGAQRRSRPGAQFVTVTQREVRQLQAQPAGIDLHAIANVQAEQRLGVEIDQHVIDAAVLAGDHAGRASRGPGRHAGPIADACAGQQGEVGAVRGRR